MVPVAVLEFKPSTTFCERTENNVGPDTIFGKDTAVASRYMGQALEYWK